MNNSTCTLCDLPNPDPPVTDENVDGTFCCSGCLHVYQLLQDLDSEQAERVRKETISRRRRERASEEPPQSSEEAFFKVKGMHCSTCESFLESLLGRKDGIYKSEASYATELIKIYYDPERRSRDELPRLISKMGYSAYPMERDTTEDEMNTVASLVIGGFFSIIGLLLYVLFLYPAYLDGKGIVSLTTPEHLFIGSNIFVMTSFVLLYTGFPILRGAWISLSVMKPNMDLLVSIAALSAYLYSAGALIMGESEVYFDVTMAIVMVVSIGNYYESRIKKSKNRLLNQLMDKRIRQARIRRNGKVAMIELDDLMPGDRVVVKAGERIPVDGTIIEGQGVINEALITGESLPVSKKKGDHVISGTILTQNVLTIEIGPEVESTVEKLIHLMWDLQAARHGKQRLADRIAAYFVPGVLILGIATFFYHFLSGLTVTSSLLSALAVLIVSCPCALGLATPLAVASGLREALKKNILFKSGAIFEGRTEPDIFALDKTGTLTTGQMQLLDEGSDPEAFNYARAIEQLSSHPLAKAISENTDGNDITVQNFTSCSTGVSGEVDEKTIFAGQPEWLQKKSFEISSAHWTKINTSRQNGLVPVGVAWNGRVHSILVVGDQIRAEAESFISLLKKQGKQIAVITGDSEQASRGLRKKLQPDFLFTGARPESKTEIIRKLKKFGAVAMAGDGSNDAPALAEADVGIAFGDITAIAAESAQIVIPENNLHRIINAFEALRQTKLRIRQNLGWAFLYNITTIPLAIAGLINPLFAALAMAGSSLLVVNNSSRKMRLD